MQENDTLIGIRLLTRTIASVNTFSRWLVASSSSVSCCKVKDLSAELFGGLRYRRVRDRERSITDSSTPETELDETNTEQSKREYLTFPYRDINDPSLPTTAPHRAHQSPAADQTPAALAAAHQAAAVEAAKAQTSLAAGAEGAEARRARVGGAATGRSEGGTPLAEAVVGEGTAGVSGVGCVGGLPDFGRA
jgi:hypothetical protein